MTLTGHRDAITRARDDLAAVMASAREAALAAIKAGASEAQVARDLGVDRMTVRAWQGKR